MFSLRNENRDDRAFKELLEEAIKDPYLGEFLREKKETPVLIYFEEKPVGFFLPRKESDGRYRSGAIYVQPKYRKHRLAKKALSAYFEDKKGRAYIEESNAASIRLFESIGFKQTDRTYTDSDKVLLRMYLKD